MPAIHAGQDSIDRAMLIMDTLLKPWRPEGFDIAVNKEPSFSTTISVMDESIEFALNLDARS